MIWAYMIYLGANMWHEADSLTRFNRNDPRYYHALYTTRDAWRKITDYAVDSGFNTLLIDIGEGLQFESHPAIACKGAWSKEEMAREIERLKKKGMACVPKLNFASIHDAWLGRYGHMVGTPEYYRVVRDLIDEVCELFQPNLFHIGFDEESRREKHMQNEYGYSCIRYGQTYWDDVNYCIACVKKNGVRAWKWGGLVHYHPDEFFRFMDKDVVISTYNYGKCLNNADMPDYAIQKNDAAGQLDKHGFDQILTTSTCYDYASIDDSFVLWKHLKGSRHLLGYLTAPWYRTGDEDIYSHFAEAKIFMAARDKYFPEEVRL